MIYSFTAPPPQTVLDMIHVTRHTLMSRVVPVSGLCHDCSNMSHVRPCHSSNRSLLMSLHCLNLGYHNCTFIFIVAPKSYHLAKCCMDVLRGLMKFTDHPVWRWWPGTFRPVFTQSITGGNEMYYTASHYPATSHQHQRVFCYNYWWLRDRCLLLSSY